MIAFADSSALAKRYLDEEHRDVIVGLSVIVASSVAVVEVCSAIWRRQRMGELTPAAAAALAGRARTDLTGSDPSVVVIPPSSPLLVDASLLTGSAGLRGYDAIQLATARAARDTFPDLRAFACFDTSLSAAAASHGFDLVGG